MLFVIAFIVLLFLIVITKKEYFSQAIIDYYVTPFQTKPIPSDEQINHDILNHIQNAPQFI